MLLVTMMAQSVLPLVQAQTPCSGTSGNFIQLSNGYLCLSGSRVRFVGANVPNLLQAGYLPGSSSSPSGATRLGDASLYGIDLIKVWIDNPCPTAYQLLQSNPTAFFAFMDAMLGDAKANHVLLNPSLVTTHNSGCWNQWVSVLGGDPFTNASADSLLKSRWIQPIVSHYYANAQIAYWEIAAEPDCLGCGGSSDSLSSVISWANDMASYIRGIDPNHLLSADWAGFGQLKWTGTTWDYSLIDQKDQFMDFVSVHTYGGNGNLSPPTSSSPGSLGSIYQSGQTDGSLWGATNYYVNLYTAHAHTIGKAMEFSEYGQDVSSAGDTTGGWNQMILNATANRDADASEVWTWDTNGWGPWNVSPSQNPILVQSMSHWSTVMSSNGFQDFTISASSPNKISPGSSGSSIITLTALNGFTGSVALRANVPLGLTCGTLTPGSVSSSGSATLSCSSNSQNIYTVMIIGTSGSLSHNATASFAFGSAAGSSGGFCFSCIGSITLSNLDWLLIIGGMIGVTSSIALLNARASIELRRARVRMAGLIRDNAVVWKTREFDARQS